MTQTCRDNKNTRSGVGWDVEERNGEYNVKVFIVFEE